MPKHVWGGLHNGAHLKRSSAMVARAQSRQGRRFNPTTSLGLLPPSDHTRARRTEQKVEVMFEEKINKQTNNKISLSWRRHQQSGGNHAVLQGHRGAVSGGRGCRGQREQRICNGTSRCQRVQRVSCACPNKTSCKVLFAENGGRSQSVGTTVSKTTTRDRIFTCS